MGRLVIVVILVIGVGWFAWRTLAPAPTTRGALPGVDVETDEVEIVDEDPAGPPELDAEDVDVDVTRENEPEEPAAEMGLDPEDRTLDPDAGETGEDEGGELEEPQR